MKPSLFKQLAISALFVCSLSADVPEIREQALEGGRQKADDRRRMVHSGGNAALSLRACSFGLCDGHAIGRPVQQSPRLNGTMPDLFLSALSVALPVVDYYGLPMDRGCVRWAKLSCANQATINIPKDPFDVVFLVPRYRMPLAVQESAWLRPVGARLRETDLPWQILEPALSKEVAVRSGRADMAAMMPRLKQVFVKEGVPQQWVWVAEVESTLNPQARSSAGAAGLFQLMPGTAQRFGLRTEPVDERMTPEKSAGAAAQYLKILRKEFGCWSLALAAYNAGEGRVKEIMKKRNARTFNEVERYLPAETRAYVPKVMAIVALREDQLHGVQGSFWRP